MFWFPGCSRSLSKLPAKGELKGYKVTDVNRTRKFGVACRSFDELKRKACEKFNFNGNVTEVNVFLLDGSLVDEEYFLTLEAQTTMVLQKPGEQILSDADLLYGILRRVNIDFLTAGAKASEFLTDNLKAKIAVLHKTLNKDDAKTILSKKDEHPEWFLGLETNCVTKESYLHRRCQDRIRNYLNKTIEQIEKHDVYKGDKIAQQNLLRIIAFFKEQLKADHYSGFYFDRSQAKDSTKDDVDAKNPTDCYDHCPCKLNRLNDSTYYRLFGAKMIEDNENDDDIDGKKRKVPVSEDQEHPYTVQPFERKAQFALCDREGEFKCQGLWNAVECSYGGRHKINPYRSREELILFSTWNLDHRIERSRTLIPKLVEMSKQPTIDEKDAFDFYDNLFTVKNLRLVHVICHDKGQHK